MTWESTLRQLVKEETERDAAILWGHPEEPPPFNYRYEHTLAVVSTARYLQQQEGGDYRIIMASAWLHDIDKKFIKPDPHPYGRPHHGIRSARRAAEILTGLGFNHREVSGVEEAISSHVGLFEDATERTLEASILWDADKLTKVGAVSLSHAIAIAPAFEPLTTERLIERGTRWVELMDRTVAAFKTETARRLGKDRLLFLREFYSRMAAEFTMENDYAAGP